MAIEELALDELLDLDVEVATRSSRASRETPGLVSVWTRADLEAAGCRDLLDALRLLPAVEVGADVWGSLGLAVRSNWGMEGKILVTVDGHELNETDYASMPIAMRIPASLIERIEVIRGPGSAMYGGYASLAVIQVTTRATAGDGVRVDGRLSWLDSGAYGEQLVSAGGAWTLSDRGRFGVAGAVGRARASDEVYTSLTGRTLALADSERRDPAIASARLTLGGLAVSLLADGYHTRQALDYGEPRPLAHDTDFTGLYGRASYEIEASPRWSVVPRVRAQVQWPWRSVADRMGLARVRVRVDRVLAGVDVRGRPTDSLDLLLGGDLGRDDRHVPEWQVAPFGLDDDLQTYLFGDTYAQALWDTRFALVSAGVRLDWNAMYGVAASPRLALSRAWEDAHAKLIVSRAFRAPAFAQAAHDLRPETSTTLEIELGVRPARPLYVTGSLFDVRITDTIAYDVVSGSAVAEAYYNLGRSGTAGGEILADLRTDLLSVSAGYALNVAHDASDLPPDFVVPGHPAVHLGLPLHKGVVRASVHPGPCSFGANATVLGPRWAITALDGDGAAVHEQLPAALVVDLSAAARIRRTPLAVRLDVHDLLDAAPPALQAYEGVLAPVPSMGFDLGATLSAEW